MGCRKDFTSIDILAKADRWVRWWWWKERWVSVEVAIRLALTHPENPWQRWMFGRFHHAYFTDAVVDAYYCFTVDSCCRHNPSPTTTHTQLTGHLQRTKSFFFFFTWNERIRLRHSQRGHLNTNGKKRGRVGPYIYGQVFPLNSCNFLFVPVCKK